MQEHPLLQAQNFDLSDKNADSNSTTKEETSKMSILEQLINDPVADASVLTACYEFIIRQPANMGTFLKLWTKLYFPHKSADCLRVCNSLYDEVCNSAFETFANQQQDNYGGGHAKLQEAIDQFHDDYIRSNYLKTSSLEMFITLIVAKNVMPINFYILFNYACSQRNCTELKDKMINAVVDLHFVGYDRVRDEKLTTSFF